MGKRPVTPEKYSEKTIKDEIMERLTQTSFFLEIDDQPIGTRYNGGWAKEIIGINREKTNGYSLLGNFVENGKEGAYRVDVDKLYLDCGIGGSRKHQEKHYTLFTVNSNGKITILYESPNNGEDKISWVLKIWDICESFLSQKIIKKEKPKKELSHFTSDELYRELIARDFFTAKKPNSSDNFRKIEMD